ncbi:hypothetical protein ACF0H5_018653 [Mactra antiquata]
MSQSVDDTIVCLMSMGFDIKDCQDAINIGKNTIESAVEWIVAGKPGLQPDASAPESSNVSLKLRSASSSFGNDAATGAFQKPLSIPQSTDQAQSGAGQSEKPIENMQDMDSQSDSQVVSRMHLSDSQRKYKENFEQKKIDQARKQAVLEKRKQKEEHARILKEIADDREKKRLLQQSVGHSEPKKPATSLATATKSEDKKEESVTVAPSTSHTNNQCVLQIRLPDGRSLRHSFCSYSTLREVWNFTAEKHQNMDGYCFIQPFPRHEYTTSDMLTSLNDLKLTPTGSLVLQKKSSPSSSESSSRTDAHVMEVQPVPPTVCRDISPLPPPSMVHDPNPAHRWGHGISLDTENIDTHNDDDVEMREVEDDACIAHDNDENIDDDMNMVIPGARDMGNPFRGMEVLAPAPLIGQRIPPAGNVRGQGHDIFGMQIAGQGHNQAFGGAGPGQNQAFGGIGQRLSNNDNDEEYQHRSVRELALERAQARLAQPEPMEYKSNSSTSTVAHQLVTSLSVHCLRHIMHRLNDPRNQLLTLAGISEDMAQVILEFLIKEKQLKPKTLNAFIPCYLRKLILDCYPYTTNEILHSVRLHTNLSHLSLSACPLITDAGLQCLNSLKKLKKLNLSCCEQLSNKSATVLTSLQDLVSLNIESTGLTDSGVIQYLSSNPHHLQYLNASRTSVTQAIIPYICAHAKQLKSLAVEDTKVVSLSGLQDCLSLESLNVARTAIVTESLTCLSNHPGLRSLNIANTENVNGDEALKYIQGLQLHTLILPLRHNTSNVGMSYLTGMPLTSLDLTNYILIDDEAMEHVGKITSLKKLILSNTKITDVGMLFIAELKQLQVLDVDRTLITDDSSQVIGALSNLCELSMASTR